MSIHNAIKLVFLVLFIGCGSNPQADCGEEECIVTAGGETLFKTPAHQPPIISEIGKTRDLSDIFVVEVSHGDGCPAMFHVVNVRGDKAVGSNAFGNCEAAPKTKIVGNEIQFSFAGCEDCERKAQEYVVSKGAVRRTR